MSLQKITFTKFQYSKNLEGTKTKIVNLPRIIAFQYSKNLEGTKTSKSL